MWIKYILIQLIKLQVKYMCSVLFQQDVVVISLFIKLDLQFNAVLFQIKNSS